MSLGHIAVRALIAYVYLLLMLRLTGKRTVAEATPFDFVLALIVGDMVDDALWAEVPVAQFVAAVSTLMAADVLVSWLACRSDLVYRAVSGREIVLLANGRRDRAAMRRVLMNDAELEAMLRLQGKDPERAARLERATLEEDGELSVRERR